MSVEMYNFNMVEMSKALFHREHKCSLEGTLKFSRAKLVLTDFKERPHICDKIKCRMILALGQLATWICIVYDLDI